MTSAESNDSHNFLRSSSSNTDDASLEYSKSARKKTSRKRKKQKQCEAAEQTDYGFCHLMHKKTDSTAMEVDSSEEKENIKKKKRKKKKKQEDEAVEHEHEHEDGGTLFSVDNSSLNTDATREREGKMKKKNKEDKGVEHSDKGCHVSPDDSSLKTDATTEEVNSSGEKIKKKRKRKKKKKQGEAVEHEDGGPIFSVDNSSPITDATLERERKMMKKNEEGKAMEHSDKGCHVSPDDSSLKADATTEELASSRKRKRRNKRKKKQGDVADLSLVTKNGGQSEIPLVPLGRTITSKDYLKNKLLILDVNGLLADIFSTKLPKGSKPPDIYIHDKKVYKRPFCDDFIQFCFKEFRVGVWSSRVKRNLDRAVRFLFGNSASKLLFCWDRSHCTITKFFTLEDKNKPLVFKELRNLWEKTVPNLPWKKGEFNESNTLLLDDSPYKALLNPRYTAIFPHSYHFDDTNDTALGSEGDLRVYLKGLAMAENVQEYVSSHPFGQEAITEKHPSWDFYSKTIKAVRAPPK